MDIKPIRSQRDATAAKRHLAELIRSNNRGENGDAIEVWAALVEQFETTHMRLHPPSPITAIRFRMQEMGLTARQLEPFIGTRARVSEILSGKRSLSIEMMRSLHQGLGIPYESLMSERRPMPSPMPGPTMARLNDLGFELEQHTIWPFVESSLGEPSEQTALHRRSRTQRTASKTDQRALMLWQAAVLKKADAFPSERAYDRQSLDETFLRDLAVLSPRPNGPELAIAAVRSAGILVVFLPQLPGTFLDGAAMLDHTGRPVIGITLRHDRIDSFWFTLFHELSHVHLHLDALREGRSAFIDDIELPSEERHEAEADALARKSLVPDACLKRVRWNTTSTADDITRVATQSRVHPSIVAGRWQREFHNYRKFARMIERGTVREKFI